MKKRLLSTLLALCMALALLPGAALAAEEQPEGGTDASMTELDILGQRGELTAREDALESQGPVEIYMDGNGGIALLSDDETAPGTSTPTTPKARYTVLVLDCSGSMSGTPVETMKVAAQRFCRAVVQAGGNNYVAIVPFDDAVWPVTEFTNNLSVLEAAIDRLYASGGTEMNDPLLEAHRLLEPYSGDTNTRNILVLADGDPFDPEACLQTARNILWKDTNVYTLGFLHNMSDTKKETCAKFLNGLKNRLYIEVKNSDNLVFVFDDFAEVFTEETEPDTDPVIIVPGILGSKLYDNGSLVYDGNLSADISMDKTLTVPACTNQNADGAAKEYGAGNKYQTLVDQLCADLNTDAGNRPVYFFSYDWRQSAADSAKALDTAVNDVLDETGADKVDLVGYYTGGLVAASYFHDNAAKVDKIVSCAVPFEGVPAVFQVAGKERNDIFGGLENNLAASFPSVAGLAPSLDYISDSPMLRGGWKPCWGTRGVISENDYITICENIFGSYTSHTSYRDLLNYENAYFMIGDSQKTITSVKFKYNATNTSVTPVEDVRYEFRGDGIVPNISASMMRQVKDLDRSRWFSNDVTHDGMISSSGCLGWMTSVLRIGRGIGLNTTTAPDNLLVIRIACPVDVTVSDGTNTLNSTSGSGETSFGRLDLIGENNEIKVLALNASKNYDLTLTTNGDYKDGDIMDISVRNYDGIGNFVQERRNAVALSEGLTMTARLTLPGTDNKTGLVTITGSDGRSTDLYVNTDPDEFLTFTPPDPDVETAEDEETNYVSVPSFTGGTVTANPRNAETGERVTLTVSPDAGYELDSLRVTNIRGREVTLRRHSDTRYSFTMPATRVTVDATFVKTGDNSGSSTPANQEPFTGLGTPGISGIVLNPSPMPFTDVRYTDWYYNNVEYMWKHYLMQGTSDTKFEPNKTTNRAMIWNVLARMNNVRTEINPGATWYERGMLWATERGLTDGSDPMGEITREQLVTMLWRNAGRPSAQVDLSRFSDSASVSGYAVEAVRWAVVNGILTGSDGKLDPQGTATRAQVAALVGRYGDKLA